jgi:hypothetical protein
MVIRGGTRPFIKKTKDKAKTCKIEKSLFLLMHHHHQKGDFVTSPPKEITNARHLIF